MQADLILYHADCTDGWCAAWLAGHCLPEAKLVPVRYGEDPPPVTGGRVLIVDFSYPRAVLERMHERAVELFVLDHHKTAEGELVGLHYGRFEREKSGARMMWEYLHECGMLPPRWQTAPMDRPPAIVAYVEDRDLWRFELFESRAVNAALRSYPMTTEMWNGLEDRVGSLPNRLVAEGYAILRYQQQVIEDHEKRATEIEFDGHRGLAVNATSLFSEIAGELARGRPFGAAWFQRADGKRQWSLRSREGGVDVSAIARLFDGGGHARAAGFETWCDFPT